MKFINRKNTATGLIEKIAIENVVLNTIETTSRTNSNKKSFGFFTGKNKAGATLTGMAYAKTVAAYPEALVEGSTVQISALASDIANGINKNWQVDLQTASEVTTSDMEAAKEALGL